MSTFAKKVTSAVAGLAVVFSMVTPIAGVSAAYSSLDAANELATLGVIVDQSANPADYRLGDTISREELSKVISNLGGLAVVDGNSVFLDTDFASWAEKYAKALNDAGYAASNAYFNPKSNTSKIEALKWVMEAREIASGSGSNWMEARVDGSVAAGIASPFTDYNTDVTRGQVFIWAAEAIDATSTDTAGSTDPLCELLGICEEEEEEETPTVVEPTTPVVDGSATAMVSLSPQSPTSGLAAVNTPRVAMLAFDVTAGSEDVTLEKVTLFHVGLGNRGNVDDLTVYNSINEAVSRTKDFSTSNNDLDISFDNNVVVQAGQTATFTIAAKLTDNGATNTTYQIELAALEASTAVSGAGIVGAALTPTVVSNAGELSVDDDTASEDITVGEEVTLAGFSIEEQRDNEDVLIKTITLHQRGSIDADYLEDLALYADATMIGSGYMVNNDDELVMNIDYTLAADDKVDFELRGVVTGDVNETVDFEFEGVNDVYAVGLSTGFNIGFGDGNDTNTNNNDSTTETTEDAAHAPAGTNADDLSQGTDSTTYRKVEGAEINAVFDKSDIDETKVDVDDVLVGTLELTANSNDYEVTKVEVTVTGTNVVIDTAIEDMYLGGASWDSKGTETSTGTAPNNVNTLVYTFENIFLQEGVTESLDLEFDVADSVALNDKSLTFSVKVTEIEDDENNITYTSTASSASGTNVSEVMSTNAFDNKTIDIETASFTLTQTSVNDRELVLANGVETVLYKAKISVGDSDDVTIEDFDVTRQALTSSTTPALPTTPTGIVTLSVDVEDVIESATLNIGGSTYDADIDGDSVDFTSINHVVPAGSDNVEVLITAVLKDDDSIGTLEAMSFQLLSANVELEDSDGEPVATTGISTGTKDTTTILREEGTFAVKVLNEVDTDDNLENTVLAGTDSVVLAELEIEAEYEDMDVNTLEFTVPGDFSDTLNNVSIMNGSATIADGAVVTATGTGSSTVTTIKFEDFTVADADDLIEAELVADLATYTGSGDETSAQLGAVVVSINAATLDVDGSDSNNDITKDVTGAASTEQTTATSNSVAGESVAIVPTMLVFSVVETLADGTAKIKVTADSGDNTVGNSNETPEITLTQLVFVDRNGADGYRLFKDGSSNQTAFVAPNTTSGIVTFDSSNFASVDVTFDSSNTYVVVPQGTADKTYTLELSGNVASYSVNTTPSATTSSTTLDSSISLGSKTY